MHTQLKDIYWLAGLIEGDGCFTLANGYPSIKINMYDRDVIERIIGLFQPKQHKKRSDVPYQQRHDRSQPTYTAALSGARAVGWMMTLYPLMGQRRQARIRELIAIWKRGRN